MKANFIYNYQTSIRDLRWASGINAVESILFLEHFEMIVSKLEEIYYVSQGQIEQISILEYSVISEN